MARSSSRPFLSFNFLCSIYSIISSTTTTTTTTANITPDATNNTTDANPTTAEGSTATTATTTVAATTMAPTTTAATTTMAPTTTAAATTCGIPDYVGDGYCDDINNNEDCPWDGGDCCDPTASMDYCTACECLDPTATTMVTATTTATPTNMRK